ncbi:MFS transporter [Streptomyces sp. NPDC001982]|uniref:MFS transporter n=1 Tax=Streptomyces sp. NPDC001982 TaxID=3154405 RepID=UPI00332A12FE
MTDIAEEVDTGGPSTQPAGRYAFKAVLASAVGYALDGFDNLILSFCLAAIAATFALSTAQAGLLSTLTLVGAVIGGLLFGVMADYLGRVRVLTWSILVFAVFTGLTALAWNFDVMLVFRILAGLGLGGEFGIGMALGAEAFPAAKRAQATSWVGIGGQVGVLLAAFISAVVLPLGGWRLMFAIGVVPAVIAFVYRRRLHEPGKFTKVAQSGTRRQFPIRALFSDRRSTRSTVGLIVLTSVHNCGYYGLMTWMPFYLSQQRHYSITKSGLWTAVTVCGMIVGIYVFGQLADRFGRRPAFLLFFIGSAISVPVYAHLTTPAGLLLGGAVMGLFVNGTVGGYGALISESFPTQARATAVNVIYNIGRGCGGFAPWAVGLIIGASGFSTALTMFAGLYVVAMLALFLTPERKGAELD